MKLTLLPISSPPTGLGIAAWRWLSPANPPQSCKQWKGAIGEVFGAAAVEELDLDACQPGAEEVAHQAGIRMLVSHHGGANLLQGKAAEPVSDVQPRGQPFPAPQDGAPKSTTHPVTRTRQSLL